MIKQSTIENNVNLYLNLMEQKMMEDQTKINQLKNKINNAARKIQKRFRRYIFKKKTIAARKIQNFWKRINKKIKQIRQKVMNFRLFYSAYKILYFFKAIKDRKVNKHNKKCNKNSQNNKNSIIKQQSQSIFKNIIANSSKFMLFVSSMQAQMAYLKKYALYDRKSFQQQWQIHEKKQREWMWAQIKKKWVKKQGNIWINDAQKQVNAEKYVNSLIEQTYTKEYERFQQSQKRINQNQQILKEKMGGIKYAYYMSLFR